MVASGRGTVFGQARQPFTCNLSHRWPWYLSEVNPSYGITEQSLFCCGVIFTADESLTSTSMPPARGVRTLVAGTARILPSALCGGTVLIRCCCTPAGLADLVSLIIRTREYVPFFQQKDPHKRRSRIITWMRISSELRAEVGIYRCSAITYLHAWIWKLIRIRIMQQVCE